MAMSGLPTTRLFGRAVRVIIDGLLIEDLRVQLKVKKTSKKEPNECHLTIWNLSPESRKALSSKGAKVIVEAGYVGSIARIFSGNARSVDHLHDGPNWLTKVQCGDGETAYRYALVTESFKPGTAVADVFAKAAQATGLDVTDAVNTVRVRVSDQFTQGYTAHGRAALEVDRLLKGRGLEHSIQNGKLQVLPTGTATREQAVLLSPDTGLIGSPEHGTAERKTKAQALKAKSLLQPDLAPGRKCRIESEAITGDFRIETVEHKGDTAGGEWYSEIECFPLS